MIPPVRLRKRWLHETEPITGKSIEIDRRSWDQGLFEVSALSVVVNAQADALTYQLDGEVMAHHGDDG